MNKLNKLTKRRRYAQYLVTSSSDLLRFSFFPFNKINETNADSILFAFFHMEILTNKRKLSPVNIRGHHQKIGAVKDMKAPRISEEYITQNYDVTE